MQPQVAKTQTAPHLDEATFQQILQAAYIIQKENDSQVTTELTVDPEASLAIIAETQELLQSQQYEVGIAAKLMLERLRKITKAKGMAIALVADDQLTYCAAVGSLSSLSHQSRPIPADVGEFLRNEEALQRSPNDARLELLEKSDKSPVFFPVYCSGRIAALMQLSFPKSESIQKHEIRSCQLMAGLMGESISRAAEMEWKQSLAAERATMLEALERLRPQLQRLVAEPGPESAGAAAPDSLPAELMAKLGETGTAVDDAPLSEEALETALSDPSLAEIIGQGLTSTCSNCGRQFTDGEKFCGKCGQPLSQEDTFVSEVSEAPGSNRAWDTTVAAKLEPVHDSLADLVTEMPAPAGEKPASQSVAAAALTDGSTALALSTQNEPETARAQESGLQLVPETEKLDEPSPWSSATKARRWLDSLQSTDSGWLAKHGGDVSVATAALILILVIFGWNARPAGNRPTAKTPPQPSLSLFERVLVGLGVAEAPAAPIPLGNPNVQVWEDLHTGLYYCPGTDLYGKTRDGKVTNQRDAQLDQFEPAGQKTCE